MDILIDESKGLGKDIIPIGKQGENIASSVTFDFSLWKEQYGDGVITLLVKTKRRY